MPQCCSFITRELQCTLDSIEGEERCRKHHDQNVKREAAAGPVREGGCKAICSNKKRCTTFAVEGTTLCKRHEKCEATARAERERIAQQDITIGERARFFIDSAMEWRLCLQLLLTEWRENLIVSRVFWQITRKVVEAQGGTLDELDDFYNQIRFMQILPYQQPFVRPVGELQRLAEDSQNVHTKEVSAQTQKMTDLLLAYPVPEGQRTLQKLSTKFGTFCHINQFSRMLQVLADVNIWYEKATCINEGDALYRRLLDAAVSKMDASPAKIALYKRAYEETAESVGLCCQGHLSRLINIFSGFDSEFSSPVSKKELLQEKIAQIAASEVSTEDKIRQATDTLVELDIPKEEWTPWIEAL